MIRVWFDESVQYSFPKNFLFFSLAHPPLFSHAPWMKKNTPKFSAYADQILCVQPLRAFRCVTRESFLDLAVHAYLFPSLISWLRFLFTSIWLRVIGSLLACLFFFLFKWFLYRNWFACLFILSNFGWFFWIVIDLGCPVFDVCVAGPWRKRRIICWDTRGGKRRRWWGPAVALVPKLLGPGREGCFFFIVRKDRGGGRRVVKTATKKH